MYNSQPNLQVAAIILQLEQQIRIIQQLVSSLKFAEQTRTQQPPYRSTGYPINTNPQRWYTDLDRPIWDRPAPQPQTGQMGGSSDMSYTDRMTERAEAFRFFEQHKDALSPIQNLFNQSMGVHKPDLEIPDSPVFYRDWVTDIVPHTQKSNSGEQEYVFTFQSAMGATVTRTCTLSEFQKYHSDGRALKKYVMGVSGGNTNMGVQMWRIGNQYIVTLYNVGTFAIVPDSETQMVNFNRPIIDLPVSVTDQSVKDDSPSETPVTEFTELKHNLTEWLMSEPWVTNDAQLIDSDVLRLDMLSTNSDKRHVLMIANDFLTKWFDSREEYDINGHDLHALYKGMLKDPNKVVTVVTFENLGHAILQVLGNSEDGVPSLFTTDYKRAMRFIEKATDQNLRWFKVD